MVCTYTRLGKRRAWQGSTTHAHVKNEHRDARPRGGLAPPRCARQSGARAKISLGPICPGPFPSVPDARRARRKHSRALACSPAAWQVAPRRP
eukprot:scaffold2109_cov188-Prasinococcus_capsulatus_cf.AAC.1